MAYLFCMYPVFIINSCNHENEKNPIFYLPRNLFDSDEETELINGNVDELGQKIHQNTDEVLRNQNPLDKEESPAVEKLVTKPLISRTYAEVVKDSLKPCEERGIFCQDSSKTVENDLKHGKQKIRNGEFYVKDEALNCPGFKKRKRSYEYYDLLLNYNTKAFEAYYEISIDNKIFLKNIICDIKYQNKLKDYLIERHKNLNGFLNASICSKFTKIIDDLCQFKYKTFREHIYFISSISFITYYFNFYSYKEVNERPLNLYEYKETLAKRFSFNDLKNSYKCLQNNLFCFEDYTFEDLLNIMYKEADKQYYTYSGVVGSFCMHFRYVYLIFYDSINNNKT
ncbi:hypothetical protein H312_00450 [Anncaliia algerae PRA339]|uniref:Uncharacterized protein n=1 Tax=Anncaliia algerae PRA339 TaxID=1288291 RepID=A0A059F4Z9_9MICR|nr:hypothetical protein H312_00450 [Anncaliia algerae PRA339]